MVHSLIFLYCSVSLIGSCLSFIKRSHTLTMDVQDPATLLKLPSERRKTSPGKLKLQSSVSYCNTKSNFLQQDTECDYATEEMCINENDNLFCAPLLSGCPCNEGEVKCGGIEGRWAGYCTTVC
ncbi:hypothetical protein ACHAW6_003536 [Cyclotella cf. meneghiniana]